MRFSHIEKYVSLLTFPFGLVRQVGATLHYYYLGTLGYESVDQKEMYRKMTERSRG